MPASRAVSPARRPQPGRAARATSQQLTSGRVNVLVATDVAARGIHVDDIDLVIQADAPDEYKTYLHRSGRTGRAGKHGHASSRSSRVSASAAWPSCSSRAEIDAPFDEVRAGDDAARGARRPQCRDRGA